VQPHFIGQIGAFFQAKQVQTLSAWTK